MSEVEQGIAKALALAALSHPEEPTYPARKAVFNFGGFIIRCEPTRAAIEAVALKYKKGSGRMKGDQQYCPRKAWQSLRVVGPYDWRKTT
ncbi:hypothetical protein K0U83_23385 [bacterium]|nr:hypothetical protein [bacterium]